MVSMNEVLNQFRRLGVKPSFFARGEIKELPNILVPREQMQHVVMGWYEGGMALLCATNHRVLLIDKKVFFLTVEDLRYDMIAEVKYQYRLLESSIGLTYSGRTLEFKSWDKNLLRKLVWFIQDTITQIEASRNNVGEGLESEHKLTTQVPQVSSFKPATPQISTVETFPIEYYQPLPAQTDWPRNPYQTGRQILRRHKISRFVTQTQLSR